MYGFKPHYFDLTSLNSNVGSKKIALRSKSDFSFLTYAAIFSATS